MTSVACYQEQAPCPLHLDIKVAKESTCRQARAGAVAHSLGEGIGEVGFSGGSPRPGVPPGSRGSECTSLCHRAGLLSPLLAGHRLNIWSRECCLGSAVTHTLMQNKAARLVLKTGKDSPTQGGKSSPAFQEPLPWDKEAFQAQGPF